MILLLALQVLLLILWYAMPFVAFPMWLIFLPLIVFAGWWAFYCIVIVISLAWMAWTHYTRS